MLNLKAKTIIGGSWSLLDKLCSQFGNLLLLIFLTKHLSPHDFGIVAMLSIFVVIAQAIADSGVSQAVIQKSNKVTQLELSTAFLINIVLSIGVYILLYCSAPLISSFFNQPEITNLSRVLFTVIIINAIALIPKALFTIDINFKVLSVVNLISFLFSALFTIYLVKSGAGYWSLVGMTISRSIVATVLLLINTNWSFSITFSKEACKSLLNFGGNLLIVSIINSVVQQLYTVLLGRYHKPADVGYFHQGYTYPNFLSSTISGVIQDVSYPILTSIQSDKERFVRIYEKLMQLIIFVSFPLLIGFACIAKEFVLIFFGTEWEPIIPILVILSISRAIIPVSILNLNILKAKGLSHLYLKNELVKLPIVVLLMFFGLPFGIIGMAISQLISVIISFFINAYYPGKLFGIGPVKQLKKILPIASSCIFMYFMLDLISHESLVTQMILKILVGAGAYFFACYLFMKTGLLTIKFK